MGCGATPRQPKTDLGKFRVRAKRIVAVSSADGVMSKTKKKADRGSGHRGILSRVNYGRPFFLTTASLLRKRGANDSFGTKGANGFYMTRCANGVLKETRK